MRLLGVAVLFGFGLASFSLVRAAAPDASPAAPSSASSSPARSGPAASASASSSQSPTQPGPTVVSGVAAPGVAFPAAWLGIALSTEGPAASRDGRSAARTDPPRGVKVAGVYQGSPAEEAGLRGSDRILSVEGAPVNTGEDLYAAMRRVAPESIVTIEVQRGNATFDLRVRVSSRPGDRSRLRLQRGWIGLKAIELPPALRSFFGAPEGAGILISHVEPGSPAERAGLAVGDVVFAVGEEHVGSLGDLSSLVTAGGVDNTLEIRLMRQGAEITVEPSVAPYPEQTGEARD